VTVEDSLRDVVCVAELIRPESDRAGKERDDVVHAVALIDEMTRFGFSTNRVHELDDVCFRHSIESVLYAIGELTALEADFFRWSQHDCETIRCA